tara:strand:+ start:2241 stop:3188 length:948 start_codon:yes stop_codon:yes gene_type:complete
MAFLDNSGDIILDAVLTDAGRARLARGDGSFKIVKYAFADDEIDYSKYNLDNQLGSAYFDIEILKTPIIEALTNNTSTMKNRLLSIPKTNLLYLPSMLLNQETVGTTLSSNAKTLNTYVVSVDSQTDQMFVGSNKLFGDFNLKNNGIFLSNTDTITNEIDPKTIMVDQGMNTLAVPKTFSIDPTLKETQYIIEIDNRLGSISDASNGQQAYSFLDDDNIASYSFGTDSTVVASLNGSSQSPIIGARGTRVNFRIRPSIELNSSTYLFTLLGSQVSIGFNGATDQTFYRIDSNVRITGATTGYRLNVPITFLKKRV